MTDELYSYDEVPYASHPFPQSHPDRLATIGRLFGMTPPAIEGSRVLELGCAAGGNILPIAAAYPRAEVMGVDLSQRAVAEGHEMIAALGLENIELRHANIADVDESYGQFDYIICHGVYSWIPSEVQDRILDICAKQLTPQGIAYISYNTYPGWHLRGTVRDIMAYHARKFDDPGERVKHARALLDFLVKAVPQGGDDAYGRLLKAELDLLRDKADFYVFHEHLEQHNEPTYFYQFDERARGHSLQYVGESEFGSMSLAGFPPRVAETLRHLTSTFEEMEQYMDFVRNRMFRQTLLCRADVTLDRTLDLSRLDNLFAGGSVRLEGDVTQSPAVFQGERGRISTTDPAMKAALLHLGQIWPDAVNARELVDLSLARITVDPQVMEPQVRLEQEQRLSASLLDAFARRFIRFQTGQSPFAAEAGERPRAFSLARFQSENGKLVSSLRHQLVAVDDLARRILVLADGQRGRSDILSELVQLVRDGQLVLQTDRPLDDDGDAIGRVLEPAMDACMRRLAADGLFVREPLESD